MTKRSIHLESYENADPRLLSWVTANGIDPWQIPQAQVVVVENGQIEYTEFVLESTVPGAPPHKTLNAEGTGYKRATRAVPLLSAPEDHGL